MSITPEIGGTYVFSGEWRYDAATSRMEVGYVGRLIGTWNGWMVPALPRPAVDDLVADVEATRAEHLADLRAAHPDATPADLVRKVDQHSPRVYFLDKLLVWDDRVSTGDETMLWIVEPACDGMYDMSSLSWMFEIVQPGDCLRVIGDL